MGQAELLIAGLLVAVAGLSALARRLSLPYPIVLVIGGALLGFVPGMPEVNLDPNVVLVVFLPLLVYGAAFFANLNDIRSNLRAVTLSSVGLVLATMVAVAVVAHELVDGLSWAASFTLGAIVSPTDTLAGAQIMRRLEFPRFFVSAIEAEGLFNDATALVCFRVAVTAVVGGSFSLLRRQLEVPGRGRRRGRDRPGDRLVDRGRCGRAPPTGADQRHDVAVQRLRRVHPGRTRCGVSSGAAWQRRTAPRATWAWPGNPERDHAILGRLVRLDAGPSSPSAGPSRCGRAVRAGLVSSRFAFVLRALRPKIRAIDRRPSQRARRVRRAPALGRWPGAACAAPCRWRRRCAIPLKTDAGAVPRPRPDHLPHLRGDLRHARAPGTDAPELIRRLHVERDGSEESEEIQARLVATKAALEQLDELESEELDARRHDRADAGRLQYRQRRFAARAGKIEDDGYEDRSLAYQQIVQLVLAAQREALVQAA